MPDVDLSTGAPKSLRPSAWLITLVIAVLALGGTLGARQQNLVDDVEHHEQADALLHSQQATAIDQNAKDLKAHVDAAQKHDQRVDEAILQINDTLKFMAGKKLHLRDPATDDSPNEGESP
jgi:hypothetical protein